MEFNSAFKGLKNTAPVDRMKVQVQKQRIHK